jgi:formyltetrahydrofolate deformylase
MPDARHLILTFSCPDVAGIQAAVTTCLFQAGAFIEEAASFGDAANKRFFGRIVIRSNTAKPLEETSLRAALGLVAERLGMNWELNDAGRRCPTVIAVSRQGHCLNDLLHRFSTGALNIDVKAVVSNHDDMRRLVEWHGLPYYHLPVTRETKAEQERAFMRILDEAGAELLVLARYMQILSADFAAKLTGRCINIHHSFLPSFKGARPYHQAHLRGVKIIGATAHYVSNELDEGPIIEQGVERIDHSMNADDFVEVGRDIECSVLARAVRWHAERRVLISGQRTIVFR